MTKEGTNSFQAKLINEALDVVHSNPFKDARVKDITEVWIKESFNVTEQQANEIGSLWITKILQCTDSAVEALKLDDTNDEIGLKHAGSVPYQADSRGFWMGVHLTAPNLVRHKDLEYLIENDRNGTAAWALICRLDGMNPMPNDVLTTRLVGNALLYK